MEQQNEIPVPPGFRRNGQGAMVHESLILPIDMARDELVCSLSERAAKLSAELAALRQSAFDDIAAFIALSAEQYQTTVGGTKGNVTLYSFDQKYRIQFACQASIAFDEKLQAARSLVDACIADWTEGSRPELKALVVQAFDADREGQVNTGRILALRRLQIDDERWKRAMQAIGESILVVGSKQYVRFYVRKPGTDEYVGIRLDLANA